MFCAKNKKNYIRIFFYIKKYYYVINYIFYKVKIKPERIFNYNAQPIMNINVLQGVFFFFNDFNVELILILRVKVVMRYTILKRIKRDFIHKIFIYKFIHYVRLQQKLLNFTFFQNFQKHFFAHFLEFYLFISRCLLFNLPMFSTEG